MKVKSFATKLVEKEHDGNKWSITEMLEEAIREIQAKEITPTKGIFIFLDDTGDKYDVSFRQAKCKASEMVAMIELIKSDIKKIMGY